MTKKFAIAKNKYTGISVQKTRLVADMVRMQNALDVLDALKFVNRSGSKSVYKTISSAVANAKVAGLSVNSLFVSKIMVDEAPTLKRARIASRHGVREILKRSSHITVVLEEINGTQN